MSTKAQERTPSGESVLFTAIEPWLEPVSGADLLNELVQYVRRHAVVSEHQAIAIALFVLHTYLLDYVGVSPVLALLSPEKRCGKTTILTLLSRLVHRSLPCSNITPAAVFRAIDAWHPTLLIDEADTFIRNSDEIRGVLNSGHTREAAYVVRTVGDNHEPRRFCTWGAKVIALIGKLPDTLQDRAIVIHLRRKLPQEKTEKLRHADGTQLDELRRRCARFAQDIGDAVQRAQPDLPPALNDRAADNWEPLLAIADQAGEVWSNKAREAALALSGETAEQDDSRRVMLLGDIREVFASKKVERLASGDLIGALVEMEDRPWSEYSRSQFGFKKISPRQLSQLLSPFGIAPKDIRFDDQNLKGYRLEQFEDAFDRYAPQQPRQRYEQASTRNGGESSSAADGPLSRDEELSEAASPKGCSGVADHEGEEGGDSQADADDPATERL